jgi:SAM-dependent methyltransferase
VAKIPIERLDASRWAPPWTRREHHARYEFSSQFVAAKSVVDCACGDGTSSGIFGRTAHTVHGFDVSSDAVERANQINQRPSVVLQCASATALPLAARSSEVFISLETIEHVTEDQAFLDEVVRVLRDDGTFVCSTPDRDVHSPGNTSSDQPWTHFHVREYSADEFGRLLKARFATVTFFGQNPESARITRIKCWIGRTISRSLVLRLNQFAKLGWMFHPRSDRHDVVPIVNGRKYEYLVAVCSDVVRKSSTATSDQPDRSGDPQ